MTVKMTLTRIDGAAVVDGGRINALAKVCEYRNGSTPNDSIHAYQGDVAEDSVGIVFAVQGLGVQDRHGSGCE